MKTRQRKFSSMFLEKDCYIHTCSNKLKIWTSTRNCSRKCSSRLAQLKEDTLEMSSEMTSKTTPKGSGPLSRATGRSLLVSIPWPIKMGIFNETQQRKRKYSTSHSSRSTLKKTPTISQIKDQALLIHGQHHHKPKWGEKAAERTTII